MQNLVKLFSILQLTKEQPLTGYLLGGIRLHEVETLAEHHYGACIIAYFLLKKIKREGGKIDGEKIMSMLLVHDLGELFGGDISAPLHRRYPELTEYKNKIGEKAMELLAGYLEEPDGRELKELFNEFEHGDSDETKVARIIDQMDHQFFFEHYNIGNTNLNSKGDFRDKFVLNNLIKQHENIKDEPTRRVMNDFVKQFAESSYGGGFRSYILME
ncbi:HD domain-containing protein [Patescibacteria group bacterium]|nr:MAG: HD domain-containing protein [Patescibacteria group bacterium]